MAGLMRNTMQEMSDPMRVEVLALMLGFSETNPADKRNPTRLKVAKLPVSKKDRKEAEDLVRSSASS